MSIEISAQLAKDTMSSSQPSKSHKKHRSASEKEKKKRKREGEDGHRSKSKKHKSDKTASQTTPAPEDQEKATPFHIQTSSLHLPLAPISQSTPLEGLCAEHISLLILRYFPPFGGVIL